MKKIVYVIISIMALVLFINISAFSESGSVRIESKSGVLEINPLY